MTTEKSPISILQELAQIKRIPLPVYDVEALGKTFRVTLKLGTDDKIISEGVNINKKLAKQLCAENALKSLNIKNVEASLSSTKHTFINANSNYHYNNNKNLDRNSNLLRKSCSSLSSLPAQFDNHVGKLNEICSKRMLEYPTYRECGIVNGEFVTECKIFDNTITQGRSKTKKDAKQKAAEAMFKLLSESRESRCQDLMEFTKAIDRLSKQPLNVHDEVDVAGSQRKSLVELDTHPATKRSDISEVAYLNEQQLKMELEKMNVIYRVTNLQTANKATMMLKTKPTANCKSFTFLASGDDKEKVGVDLLRRAVFGLRILKD